MTLNKPLSFQQMREELTHICQEAGNILNTEVERLWRWDNALLVEVMARECNSFLDEGFSPQIQHLAMSIISISHVALATLSDGQVLVEGESKLSPLFREQLKVLRMDTTDAGFRHPEIVFDALQNLSGRLGAESTGRNQILALSYLAVLGLVNQMALSQKVELT